jgi:hypothetical protein
VIFELFGYPFAVLEIKKLIVARRAAGRPKDMVALPELRHYMNVNYWFNLKKIREKPDG